MINYMQQLSEIAVKDPRLAVALLRSNVSQPQAYTMEVTFASGAPDKPVEAQSQPFTEDFWVYGMQYTLNQPKLWEGNLFRGLAQVTNNMQPGIKAQISINGGVGLPWQMSPNPVPIETLLKCAVGPGAGPQYGCNTSFVMFFPQVMKGTFWLTREYTDAVGISEIPATLTVAFNGLTLGVKNYGGLTTRQAREILRSEFGEDRPDVVAGRIANHLRTLGVVFPDDDTAQTQANTPQGPRR